MLDYFRTRHFVRPPYLTLDGFSYLPEKGVKTYSEYNYLKPGLASFLRTRHLEYALRMVGKYPPEYNVIDFGCADGSLLPSLSRRFKHVVGIDSEPDFIKLAAKVTDNLANVQLICNQGLGMGDLRAKLAGRKYQILFLLETLEHIGDKNNLWESRVEFVRELFTLIDKSGVIIISVPVMVGLPFLIQRVGLFVFNAKRDKASKIGLLKAYFLNDTDDLEKQWHPWRMGETGHIGFNHKKLEVHLKREFDILEVKNILFQVLYVCSNE